MSFGFRILADLNEKEDRIQVTFPYHRQAVLAVKKVPGYHFIPAPKGGPHWLLPMDLTSARILREQMGEELDLGPKLKKWAKDAIEQEREIVALTNADDAELTLLPEKLPELHEFLRPYQRADVAVMARKSVINANEPGLGKTVEAIAAIAERDALNGSHLIIAPKTSLEVVWQEHLEKWTDLPVIVASGDDSPDVRQGLIDLAMEFHDEGTPFFLVMNPAFIRYKRDKSAEKIMYQGHWEYPMAPQYEELFAINWTSLIVDEYHLMGLANNKTAMFKAANDITADWKALLSGTPMGGKPVKLWGALHFLMPESFTSKWRWVNQWLNTEEVQTPRGMVKVVHGVRKEREQQFNEHLNPHMIRRTKAEVVKELPEIDHQEIWCEMSPRQKKQYETFAANAELKIEEENLSATGILAEYTRLKQFAMARQTVKSLGDGKFNLVPTTDSGKLPQIMRLLEERGITPNEDDQWGDGQVVIGSQFSTIIDMVVEYLTEQGIPCHKITGAVGSRKREEIVRDFQNGGCRVIALTTTAGGVAITLDRADTVIILDETWNPDDQAQLEQRVHRISRIHQVTAFYLRSKNSIEQYIQEVTMMKGDINEEILDLRRAGFRAIR